MDIAKYLHRLDILSPQPPSLPFLKILQRQHLLHIPFENLDIHWGKEILLDNNKIFDKVVRLKRGGFCYELNSIFFLLLSNLGFRCYLASAKTLQENGKLSPDFEHMCILVQLEGNYYLCDVGYGRGPISPLLVKGNQMQISLNQFYRIRQVPESGWWLEESVNGQTFDRKYLFSPKKRNLIEFVDRCQYQQRNPGSHFKRGKMITQATSGGRKTLTEKLLVIDNNGEKKQHTILNQDDFYIKLEEHFDIKRPKDWA